MKPLQQLKQTKKTIKLDGSATDVLYDHCPDFHFVFDVEVKKKWSKDEGTDFAPVTWDAEHRIEITKLKVLNAETFEQVYFAGSQLLEIAKELINKIEIQ